jgi:transposase
MAKALSTDLRERLVLAVEGGQSRRSAAKAFGVSAATAIRWVDQWRRSGSIAPKPRGGDNRSYRIEAHAEAILALIEATPDITLAELTEHLEETHGVVVAQSTIWRLLDRRGLTFKKNRARQRTTAS